MSGTFFSADFRTARQRFLAGVASLRGELYHLPFAIADSNGDPLGLDIAWFGNRQPRRALIHVCGIHGIEGFAGSAVQLALLENLPSIPDDTALLLVHVLNPYGMAQLRRGNENNVDLNRNFFFNTAGWQGVSDGYTALDGFLNPPRPPAHLDFFHLRLLLAELSLGGGTIRQAVAGGQYRFPKGIFYGGSTLEEGPRLYVEWLVAHLGSVRELFVIDVHTGLGSFGEQSLFLRSNVETTALENVLGIAVATDNREAEVMGYEHEGGHGGIFRQLLPKAEAVCVTAEFGTYNGRRLLRALRAENQHHHYGDGRLDHWSKRKLKAMFCPDDERWRGQVVTAGVDLIRRSLELLASGTISRLTTKD